MTTNEKHEPKSFSSSKEKTEKLINTLNRDDDDNWTYKMIDHENGLYSVAIFDEDELYVGAF